MVPHRERAVSNAVRSLAHIESVMASEHYVLIYDAACPLCCAAVDALTHQTPPTLLEALPCRSDARAARFPSIAEAACLRAVHLIAPDGTVFQGAETLPHLLRLTRRWRWLAPLLALPGISGPLRIAYRTLAPRRLAVSRILGMRACHGRCDATHSKDKHYP